MSVLEGVSVRGGGDTWIARQSTGATPSWGLGPGQGKGKG